MLRLSALLGLLAVGLGVASGAPIASPVDVCAPGTVSLELRPLSSISALGSKGEPIADYQLAFLSVHPQLKQGIVDFVDIHYRVNNEDSVNMRVRHTLATGSTREEWRADEAATGVPLAGITDTAKIAKIDGIKMEGGDVLRAYATYKINGVACDSAIHTFNAPKAQLIHEHHVQQFAAQEAHDQAQAQAQAQQQAEVDEALRAQDADHFWTQAAEEAEVNGLNGVCPAIALDQDIFHQAGLRNTYVLSFENKTPARQLHYVDLHLTNAGASAPETEWDNLRLASDMQLHLAHKVLQPGVVLEPSDELSWYFSYRVAAADGQLDCTTPVHTITADKVAHSIDLAQFA